MAGYSLLYAEHRLSDTYSYSPIRLHELPTPLKNKELKISPIQSWFSLPLTPSLSLVSVKAVKYSLSWCFLTSQTPTASSPATPLAFTHMHCCTQSFSSQFLHGWFAGNLPPLHLCAKLCISPPGSFPHYTKLQYSNTAAQPKFRNGGWGSPNPTPQQKISYLIQKISYLISHIKKILLQLIH